MKKPLLLATGLLAFAASAIAAPFTPQGLPADSQGVVHIDFDTAMKSKIGTAIQKKFDQNKTKAADEKALDEFQKEIGFNPKTDLGGITLGLLKPSADKDPEAVAVIRGKFSPEKITAALKKRNIAVTTAGGVTSFDGKALGEKLIPGFGKNFTDELQQKSVAGIIDKNTLVFANSAAQIAKIAGAVSGKTKSYAPPPALTPFGKQVGTPIALVYIGKDLLPKKEAEKPGAGGMFGQMPDAENIYLAFAENGANLQTRVSAEYADATAAQQTQGTVQMLLGFLQMGLSNTNGPDGKPDPEKVENAKKFQKFMSLLKMSTGDKNLNIALDYPAADAIKALEEFDPANMVPAPEDGGAPAPRGKSKGAKPSSGKPTPTGK